ncbi:MAG: hypothetical protein VYA80_05050 [Pseudomonadota bacterium]|nr:hypothetical protein [Pseudomonadota bacterium]
MSGLVCWRCGLGLDQLSLPLSRMDECPECKVHLHVCKMCQNFDPSVTLSCREDDAEEVREKQSANFCDYFKAANGAFDQNIAKVEQLAKIEANSLFYDSDQLESEIPPSNFLAEDLFKEDKG